MGAKSESRKAFLHKHPLCCFCGGVRKSEEVDHVPSRVLFKDRQWPEGFEFPSCIRCNRATRLDEQVVAMLALVNTGPTQLADSAEVKERMRAVAYNHPALLAEMQPTIAQLRDAGRKYGIKPGAGQTHSDLPLLSVRGPLVNTAINNFARKLACALFYHHTGSIAPSNAAIAVRWYSNLQIEHDEIPRELANLLVGLPTLQRANTNLNEQFFYRWVVSDTKAMTAFLAFFRQSFAILVFVNSSELNPGALENATILHPYAWA